ncbi:MAG: hypothetical protein U0768_06810 [Anaerolineae bacterium]
MTSRWRELARRADSPLWPALAAAAAYALLLAVVLGRHGFNVAYLVQAGDAFADPARTPPGLVVLPGSQGYDGQFYYRLALSPLSATADEFGIRLDNPAYRQQRILYPLAAWALSLGHAEAIPLSLALVNYVAVCALGLVGGLYARAVGRHALWGLVFPFYPGLVFTLTKDLTEAVAGLLLLTALWLTHRRRWGLAALGLSLAVLTRETVVVVPVAAALVWAFARFRHRKAEIGPPVFGPPLLAWAIWQTWLWARWGVWPMLAGGGNVTVPGAGITTFVARLAQTPLAERVWAVELLLLLALILAALLALSTSRALLYEKTAWLMYLGLMLVLSGLVWSNDQNFLRAATELLLLGLAILIGSASRLRLPMAAASLAVWAILAAQVVQAY